MTGLWSASLFIVALILFIKAQKYILIVTTAEGEAIVHRIRLRLLDGAAMDVYGIRGHRAF